VAERDQSKNRNDANPHPRHWVKHAITLLLLLALIVTGAAAYFARQRWWEMYMSLTH
jgi:hypothetical protein